MKAKDLFTLALQLTPEWKVTACEFAPGGAPADLEAGFCAWQQIPPAWSQPSVVRPKKDLLSNSNVIRASRKSLWSCSTSVSSVRRFIRQA
jgi:hypothetical protein